MAALLDKVLWLRRKTAVILCSQVFDLWLIEVV
jgi:hypothetical protein